MGKNYKRLFRAKSSLFLHIFTGRKGEKKLLYTQVRSNNRQLDAQKARPWNAL